MGFIDIISLSVGHLILLKGIGSVKSMRPCSVAYVRGGCDAFAKWRFEIRAVIKYVFKKEMPPKEIHENFMEALEIQS